MPRRYVDEQVADLAASDGGEVLAEGVEMAAVDEIFAGINDAPGLTDEGLEVGLGPRVKVPVKCRTKRAGYFLLAAFGRFPRFGRSQLLQDQELPRI